MPTLWHNGHLKALDMPAIMATDRGYRLGDGLFETIRVAGGHACWLADHLARLAAGMVALSITPDKRLQPAMLAEAIAQTIAANRMQDGMLRLIVSRGGGGAGYLPGEHAPPELTITPTADRLPALPLPPAALHLSRWRKPGAQHYPTRFKTLQGLNSTLAQMEAAQQGAEEALLLTDDGRISEAAAANIFWRQGGRWHTPALDCHCLEGVTRGRLIALTDTQEHPAPMPAVLEGAEAVILTNSRQLARPVASLAPQGWRWDSMKAAAECCQLLEKDAAA